MTEDNQILDPQEAADVNAASGQSTEDSTQTEVAEAPAETLDGGETAAAATSFPWESDERFKGKSPDDMFKIVSEADKYKGQLSQKAKLVDQLSEKFGLTPERMEQIAQREEEKRKQAYYQENPMAPFQEELMTLKEKIAMQEQQAFIQQEDSKLDGFLKEKPQFADFREDIRRIGYTIDRDSNWNDIAEKYFGRAIVKGQEAAYQKMGVKQLTQSAGVSKDMPKGKPSLSDLESLSSKEIEALIP